MAYIIRDREAGNEIARFEDWQEAYNELNRYEEIDKEEGTYTEDFYEIIQDNESLAHNLVEAIRKFGEDEEALENFELYLGRHFETWFKKFVRNPECLVEEFTHFAHMYDKEEMHNG